MITSFLSRADYHKWDSFLATSPQGNLFARTTYLEHLGVSYEILVTLKDEEIKGGIVITKDRWNYHINPVLCKYLGIFFYPFEGNQYKIESRAREVQKALIEKLSELNSFEFTFHPNYTNWMPFERAGYHQSSRYTYILNLKEEHLLAQANARLRNKINKTKELPYTIEENPDFQQAFPIIEQTYGSQKLPLPIKKKNLLNIIDYLQKEDNYIGLGLFNERNQLQAYLGLFHDEKTAYLILNGSLPNLPNGLTEALIFQGIKSAKAKGLQTFDFEGSMIPTIESFYRQFGGKLTPYFKIWKESKQRTLRNLKQKITA